MRPEITEQPLHPFVCMHLVQDLDSIARFIRGFTVQSLLPKLEERLLRLNSTITATRKGLRNRFTRFWKGNTEDTTTDK